MQKGKLLSLVMALVLMLAVAASAGATVAYDYRLPNGYDANKDISYPVVYILPQNGYDKDTSAIYDKFKAAMDDGVGMGIILVKPEFKAGMDLNAELDDLVSVIDSKFNTIADPAYRTLVGTNAGGYLAYALGLNSTTFGNLASINGNFVDNPWYATYGDVLTKIKDLGSSGFGKYYTYMDAPVEGTWTNMPGSSNDIGEVTINFGLLPNVHEYTVRLGTYDNAFVTESVNRVADRLTNNMIGGLVSGTVSLDKGIYTAADANLGANYSVKIGDALTNFAGSDVKVNVTVSVKDGSGKTVVSKTDSNLTATAGATLANDDLSIANKATETGSVELSIEILGAKISLGTANLIFSQAATADAVDLMGDWYFNYVGSSRLDMAALSSTDDGYKSWAIGQPGLDWWVKGFADLDGNHPLLSRYANSSWFNYMITGTAYYVREFTVPANFKIDGAVLSVGYLDDRGEVYVNGVRIGGTGITADGASTGESAWEKYSAYELGENESVINLGGKNTIVVRCHNDGMGGGGWYAGPIGLYSAEEFANVNPDAFDPHFYEETLTSKYAASALGKSGTIENPYLIYLPEDYYETDRFYPTMYLLHQFNSTHTSYKTDAVNELINDAVAKGLFSEMVVVVPNSEESSWWTGDWMTMITDELIPHIEANYRVIPDARYRLTAGCSMGGQGAFGVALRNPDYFTGAVSFFGAFSMGGNASPNTIAGKESAEYMDYFKMAFICGNQDMYKFGIPAIQLNQQLEAMGVEHYFFIENGEHNSAFYVPYFQDTVAYVRNKMYDDTAASARQLIEVDYSASGTTLTATFSADKAIKKYFNVIPASSYTKNTNPGVTIPVVATIEYDVKPTALSFLYSTASAAREFTDVKFNVTFDDNNLVVTEEVDLTDVLPAGAKVKSATFHTQLLGRENVSDDDKVEPLAATSVDLPSTGDTSNIIFFAALLMASVIGMVIVGKKKAAC